MKNFTLALLLGLVVQSPSPAQDKAIEHRIDDQGRLNFGIGKDKTAWIELRLQPQHESLLRESEELVKELRATVKKLPQAEADWTAAFWKGGFLVGFVSACAFQGAIGLAVAAYRRREPA